jgi:glycosyltransferase involved in cell wall biosynthesis
LQTGAGVKLKVVEAMSKGVPLVTSSVGAQGLPDLDALLPVCDGAEAIAAAIVRILLMSDEVWLEQAASELRYVREHFSRDAMKQSLADALELAARAKPVE